MKTFWNCSITGIWRIIVRDAQQQKTRSRTSFFLLFGFWFELHKQTWFVTLDRPLKLINICECVRACVVHHHQSADIETSHGRCRLLHLIYLEPRPFCSFIGFVCWRFFPFLFFFWLLFFMFAVVACRFWSLIEIKLGIKKMQKH